MKIPNGVPNMKRLATLLALFAPVVAAAQVSSMSTLQDLPEVVVAVRAITADGEKFGLTEESLVQVVSDGLKIAGVKVIEPGVSLDAGDVPTLEITAIVNRLSGEGHIYSLRLALRELVTLNRKTKNLVELGAITWEKETQGYTSKPDRIVNAAATLADRFVTEWKAAK